MSLNLEKPLIYLITKGEATDSNSAESCVRILETVRAAVEQEISLIQIREKRLSGRQLFELTAAAAEITHGSETRLLVNDRSDIALAAKADGVHLTTSSLSAAIIRKTLPKNFVIGVSTHSVDEAILANKDGADFAVFGPVFTTPGKGEPCGLTELHAVCEKLKPFPIIGLGGIDETNFESVLRSGASGIAAIRYLIEPVNLRKVAARLLR